MTKKQSNSISDLTHFREGCQALLFRFKDEFGKEKSLALKGRRLYPEFYSKDFTPSCTTTHNTLQYILLPHFLGTGKVSTTETFARVLGYSLHKASLNHM